MEVNTTVVRKFVPVTIVLSTEVEVANVVGALIAYGTANTFAENGLKAIGLGDFYSGNVRKAAREIAKLIVAKSELGVEGLEATLEAYLSSDKFRASAPSQAGAKAIGTSEDLAPGREATNFESNPTPVVEESFDDEFGDEFEEEASSDEYFG
jgi:hypothetical protein